MSGRAEAGGDMVLIRGKVRWMNYCNINLSLFNSSEISLKRALLYIDQYWFRLIWLLLDYL